MESLCARGRCNAEAGPDARCSKVRSGCILRPGPAAVQDHPGFILRVLHGADEFADGGIPLDREALLRDTATCRRQSFASPERLLEGAKNNIHSLPLIYKPEVLFDVKLVDVRSAAPFDGSGPDAVISLCNRSELQPVGLAAQRFDVGDVREGVRELRASHLVPYYSGMVAEHRDPLSGKEGYIFIETLVTHGNPSYIALSGTQ